jgi:hypothetical protein
MAKMWLQATSQPWRHCSWVVQIWPNIFHGTSPPYHAKNQSNECQSWWGVIAAIYVGFNDASSSGRMAALEPVWNCVGRETVVVCHAGHNDLNVLRWIHPLVIGTQILNSRAGGGEIEGLRNLCSRLAAIGIQTGAGHCSLEDAWATRELALILIQQHTQDPTAETTVYPGQPFTDIDVVDEEFEEFEKYAENVEEALYGNMIY